jgi:hypothetical protein
MSGFWDEMTWSAKNQGHRAPLCSGPSGLDSGKLLRELLDMKADR